MRKSELEIANGEWSCEERSLVGCVPSNSLNLPPSFSKFHQILHTTHYLPITKKAFTLAEVLITLGIIGVVAALSIPALVNSINDTHYKTAYKKAFAVGSQAWESAMSNNELVYLDTTNNLSQRLTNFEAFQSHFIVTQSCWDATNLTASTITSCWASGNLYWGAFPTTTSGAAFIDNSGMSWALVDTTAATNTNSLLVDTNGLKAPNKYGQDRFVLIVKASNVTNSYGDLTKIIPPADCLSTIDCAFATAASTDYQHVCPSVASHPCYYKSWLTGEN